LRILSSERDFEDFLASRTSRVRHERFLRRRDLDEFLYEQETERLLEQIRVNRILEKETN
jgi:hypothetical protein